MMNKILKTDISLLRSLIGKVDEWYKNVGAQRFLRYDREPNKGTKDFLQEVIDVWGKKYET